jgi:aldehyde:ferredoxin oxidoreductase
MYHLPGREKGRWDYIRVNGRYLDKAKLEEFKTRFYNLEEWDIRTGWPKRKTLESLGLKFVADELETKGQLGA